ncbi:RecB family exonuclease [Desulfurobacterium thermolithotrophum]|uniref:RecB family exonuclease n=1 Tax=Desulfurobacterium thermolithotrophum TaxID=64160 RepID=UPI0013D1EE1B|nr:PD-(D/E)XK nuclease family protein [Desulfurobacterium thermolithotrophum]
MELIENRIEIKHLRPWSFSKVQKAKRCQYEFYWNYVEKKEPLERADFLVLGSGVHFVLENALNTVFERERPLSRDLLFYFAETFKKEEPLAEVNKIAEFFPNILKYVNGQLRRAFKSKFIASELELAVDKDFNLLSEFCSERVFLRGKLDFVFSKGDTLYIVDHKTSRSRDFNNRIKTQLRWYALLANVKFPEFKRFALEVHNVRYGTVNRFIFTENDLKLFKLRLLPIIENIEEELLGKSFSELIPSPCESNCRWCDFRHICQVANY